MPLPSTYPDPDCSIARALEVVGERWTLMIVRDAFFGVRRFGDFATQLGVPRAILSTRLRLLVEHGVFAHADDGEYTLTEKGLTLWPVVRSLLAWGDQHYAPAGVSRILRHDLDAGLIDGDGRCAECGLVVPVPEIRLERGPGHSGGSAPGTSRLLLEPVTR